MLNKSKCAQISTVSRDLSFNESEFQSSAAIITSPFVFNLDRGTANKH